MGISKRILSKRILIFLFCFLILLFILYLVYIGISDYKPIEKIAVPINNNVAKTVATDEVLTIATYNIGHAGMDQNRDFYTYGGKSSKASSIDNILLNLEGLVTTLDQINFDFLLLQEVDTNSSRSHKVNELEFFKLKYPNFSFIYGKNHDIDWMPFPVFKPMGKVESGIATFSKFNAIEANRYELPGQEDGFHKFFDLDRCFTVKRFEIENGQNLVIINLQLSDFGSTGLKRQEELRYLRNYLDNERKEDSYIIVGGDWNHNLPGTDPYFFRFTEKWPSWLKDLPEEFSLDGFNWAIDSRYPTVRNLMNEFKMGNNFLAIVDGFLVSDNIEVLNVETINDNFIYSNHNPVKMEFIIY